MPKLYTCLNCTPEGPIWEETAESWRRRPGFVTVSHPPVRRVLVYAPGQEACDFSGLFVVKSPQESEISPPEDSDHHSGFVLNTDASNTNQEHHFEGDLEAAAALAVEAKALPLRMVLPLLISLRRIRVRLAATSGPRDVLVRSSLAWLAREQASLQERKIYLGFVVPVLAKCQEETRLEALRREVGRRAGSQEDKDATTQVQELLDEMQAPWGCRCTQGGLKKTVLGASCLGYVPLHRLCKTTCVSHACGLASTSGARRAGRRTDLNLPAVAGACNRVPSKP